MICFISQQNSRIQLEKVHYNVIITSSLLPR